jgi:putative acyl-CoA dehydrogenase
MRKPRAQEQPAQYPHQELMVRHGNSVGKYWICKRTPQHAYEAMECIGGSGVMEDSPFPRLFRESPVNAIWEGSGNVQCLDVLRAMQKTPEVVEAFFAELARAQGASPMLDRSVAGLQQALGDPDQIEYRARDIVDRMALALQAALLLQHAPTAVAEAFCTSRLGSVGTHQYGALPRGVDVQALIERAMPQA